jgi:hypothetical protein
VGLINYLTNQNRNSVSYSVISKMDFHSLSNTKSTHVCDIDTLPLPVRNLLEFEKYVTKSPLIEEAGGQLT